LEYGFGQVLSLHILDKQFEKYTLNLEVDISILAVQAHDNLFDQNIFNMLEVFLSIARDTGISSHYLKIICAGYNTDQQK
jgi:hypothetical protein